MHVEHIYVKLFKNVPYQHVNCYVQLSDSHFLQVLKFGSYWVEVGQGVHFPVGEVMNGASH